jgi:hypothetical protein
MGLFMPITGQPPTQPDNAPKAKQAIAEYAQWGKINPKLLANIYTVDKHGNRLGNYTVTCAITEGTFEVGSEYSSPFEANPDQRMPTLMGMIQSGEFVSAVGSVAANAASSDGSLLSSAVAAAASGIISVANAAGIQDLGSALQQLEGKTNLTKVNSTQIFVSTKPVEISVTLYFRAWRNAKTEVEEPISWLEQWGLPVSLSTTGTAQNVSKSISEGKGALAGLFPSNVPPFVALNYAGKTFLPFTLRNVSKPLVVERDKDMNALACVVTAQLSSRAAWDATDIQKLYGY